jgi:hypothetical protein
MKHFFKNILIEMQLLFLLLLLNNLNGIINHPILYIENDEEPAKSILCVDNQTLSHDLDISSVITFKMIFNLID